MDENQHTQGPPFDSDAAHQRPEAVWAASGGSMAAGVTPDVVLAAPTELTLDRAVPAPATMPESAIPTETAGDTGIEASDQKQKIDSIIKSWIDDHLRNSVIARSTESWNHLILACEELSARIFKELK